MGPWRGPILLWRYALEKEGMGSADAPESTGMCNPLLRIVSVVREKDGPIAVVVLWGWGAVGLLQYGNFI